MEDDSSWVTVRGKKDDPQKPFIPFLFPLNRTGLGMIGLFIVCRLVLLGVVFIPIPMIGLVAVLLDMVVTAYLFWYTSLCVQAAAEGQTVAPDVLQDDGGDLKDMIFRMIRVVCTVGLCFAPSMLYYRYAGRQVNELFWNLFAAGLFVLPMALLSVVLNDSLTGLNPIVIIMSIVRTFVKYLVLVLCFSIPVGLFALVGYLSFTDRIGLLFSFPAQAVSIYLMMVGAAMLGRFFYRNETRLDWGM